MWDQVRVDHGTEFYLTLYMQERNSDLRVNTNREPYIQTQSKRVSIDYTLHRDYMVNRAAVCRHIN